MPAGLELSIAPEVLEEGTDLEKATFGIFVMKVGLRSITEGFDHFLQGYRPGPLVPGYHVAEWLAWNWWRLRWEPRSAAPDWALAHRMTSIGESFVWPNISIFSDGIRTALLSDPSVRVDAKPFRFVGSIPTVMPSQMFEGAVDAFMPQILGRLPTGRQSNLGVVWRDVLTERADAALSRRRQLEALLGRDADAAQDGVVDQLLTDGRRLGEDAVNEVAAERAQDGGRAGSLLTADDFGAEAASRGFDANPRDAVTLRDPSVLPRRDEVPAWRLGAAAAQALREEQGLGAAPLSDKRLAEMAGVSNTVVSRKSYNHSSLSFELVQHVKTRVVLRSKWEVGRRFDLARLVGDKILNRGGFLHPATRSLTYRQKAQRSFAAELLSPFQAVDEMLSGDYSDERQQEIAEHFYVSSMTINTALKNHRRIEREANEDDVDLSAA